MKRTQSKCLIGMVIVAMAVEVMVLKLNAQANFNQSDEQLILRYKRANPLYLDGKKQFLRKNTDKAEKKFLECLALMPEHAYASCGLAKIYLMRGEFTKALDLITAAKKNYILLAQFQIFGHQEYLENLRVRRAKLEEQILNIQTGESRGEQKDAGSAISRIRKEIEMIDRQLYAPVPDADDIPADFFFINGNVLFKMGKLADAAEQYMEAIRVEPSHSDSYNNLASVYFALGKYREAHEWLIRAEAAGSKVNPEFKKEVEKRTSALHPE